MSIKKIVLGVLLLLIVLSFIVRPSRNEAAFDAKVDFLAMNNAPADVAQLMKAACYDCHSNNTTYPWYTKLGPVDWYLNNHIKSAVKTLNFSAFHTYDADKKGYMLNESCEKMKKRHMPLKSYTWLHSEAKLTDEDIEKICLWINGL